MDRHRTRPGRAGRGLRPSVARRALPDDLADHAAALFPEGRRSCPACDAPVGRSRDGRPGRLRGTCGHCRRPFDLGPSLAPGMLLGGRWLITGLVARGRDWLYRAVDPDGGPVVVARRAAGDTATPALLLGHGHPSLVGLRDVVEHDAAVHLVLDPVDGEPVRGPRDPAAAAAVVLGIAPAVAHLHRLGVLHADLKPGNVLEAPAGPVLVDLGSLRRLDDRHSPVWGTDGFLAPEITPGGAGPSVASEVYALGRTLDVLLGRPVRPHLAPGGSGPASTPLDAVIARATAADPHRRHAGVDELVADLRWAVGAIRTDGPGRSGVGGAAGCGAVHQDDPRRDHPGHRPDRDDAGAPARVSVPRGAFPT